MKRRLSVCKKCDQLKRMNKTGTLACGACCWVMDNDRGYPEFGRPLDAWETEDVPDGCLYIAEQLVSQ